MDTSMQVLSDFSKNSDTEGFDLQAGKTWIYPTNYPIRDYQFNIVLESLYKNTLVSLPTGLGKTFIAAVVMYNFYRWYPSGKIIFMAPTRPLVKQQMDACYNIMAIPKETTMELTGTKIQASRKNMWMNKRVFFITPQVLQNDLDLMPELGRQIKCIVIDEAHKAKGNHAYCEVLRKILENNKHFRVLALSATPGNTMNDVSEIINNLLISYMEIRTDDSPDVKPYIFQRTLETVVVPLGEKLQSVKAMYLQILEKYTRILVEHRVIAGNNCANLTKGRIFMIMKDFQEKNKHTRIKAYGDIMRNLNLCITLYHGYELLTKHGLRGFLNYFEEHSEKALLRGNTHLHNIMMDVQEYLGPKPNVEILPSGEIPKASPLTRFGHPKFYKLQDILLSHFSESNNNLSKVIVFTEYKDSVMEIYALLSQHTPTIKPKYFLGQSSITQRQQVNAIKSFRLGECNTLISTCIGEEGLDIGEVDLIICFDISNKSPIRIVQRIGRTGRRKEGKVIILVTEGKEQETLKECLMNKHYLSKNILKSRESNATMYANNPRMIPNNIIPTCRKIHISVPKDEKAKVGSLKKLLNNLSCRSKKLNIPQELWDIELIEMQDRIPDTNMIWDKEECPTQTHHGKANFSKRLEVLRAPCPVNLIGHSMNCDILTSLLQYGDSKRYNIPTTQVHTNELSTGNKKGKLKRHNSSDNYKQSDIRSMFLKSQKNPCEVIDENYMEGISDLVISNTKKCVNELINELHNEILTYLSLSCIEASCKICDNTFICYRTMVRDCHTKLDDWILPDFSVVKDLNVEDLKSFEKSLTPSREILNNTDLAILDNFMNESIGVYNTGQECENMNEKSHLFTFEAPKSAKKVFKACDISHINEVEIENSAIQNEKVNFECKLKCFNSETSNDEDTLTFLKLNTLDNLFTDDDRKEYDNDVDNRANVSPILSKFCHNSNHSNSSPILSAYNPTRRMKNNVNKKLFLANDESLLKNENSMQQLKVNILENKQLNQSKPKLSNLKCIKKSDFFKSKNSSVASIREENTANEAVNIDKDLRICSSPIDKLFTNIQDICDLSIFGLEMSKINSGDIKRNCITSTEKGESGVSSINIEEISDSGSEDLFRSVTNTPEPKNEKTIYDICDLNIFGISQSFINKEVRNKKLIQNNTIDNKEAKSPVLTNCKIEQENVDIKVKNYTEICDMSSFDVNQDSKNENKDHAKIENIYDAPIPSIPNKIFVTYEKETNYDENKDEICPLKSNSDSYEQPYIEISDTESPTLNSLKTSEKDASQISVSQMLSLINKYSNVMKSQITINNEKSDSQRVLLPTLRNEDKSKTTENVRSALKDEYSLKKHKPDALQKQFTKTQTSAKKKQIHTERKRSKSLTKYDSEDEFEESPFKSGGWICPKKKIKGTPSKIIEDSPKPINTKKRKRKKNLFDNSFIEGEAMLSSDENGFSDSRSEGGSSEDALETSFVNDDTLDIANTTAIHANYLQTTRSPLLNKGTFKIPTRIAVRKDIFSQEVDNTNNTYINDTFCVDDEDDIKLTQNNKDLSELELAELVLEEKNKRKHRNKFSKNKRMKRIVISSDSE